MRAGAIGAWAAFADLRRTIKSDFLFPLSIAPWDVDDAKKPGGACSACKYNTANQESGRVAKAECTNVSCWEQNHDAVCKAAGKVTPLSTDNYPQSNEWRKGWRAQHRNDVIRRGAYKIVKEGEKNARRGIWADGTNRGKLTWFVPVKATSSSSPADKRWRLEQQKRSHESKVQKEIARRLRETAEKAMPEQLSDSMIASAFVMTMDWDARDRLVEELQIKKSKGYFDPKLDLKLADALAAQRPSEKLGHLLVASALRSLQLDDRSIRNDGLEVRFIRDRGINVDELTRIVKAEMPWVPPEKKAAAKKVKAKKSTGSTKKASVKRSKAG